MVGWICGIFSLESLVRCYILFVCFPVVFISDIIMPTGFEFSQEMKQLTFNVIRFVENEKNGTVIPLNNVNDRLQSMLGISLSSIRRLKQEMREKEKEIMEGNRTIMEAEKRRLNRHWKWPIGYEIQNQYCLVSVPPVIQKNSSYLLLRFHANVVILVVQLLLFVKKTKRTFGQ